MRARWPLILLFVVSLPAVTPRIYSSDEALYYAYLRSLWFDRDLSFDNEYRHFYDSGMVHTDLFRQTFLERTTATGQRINFATVGCAILWSPFYAIADAGVHLARLAGAKTPADGYSRPYLWAVAFGSATYGFLSLLLSLAVARRLIPRVSSESVWRQCSPAVVTWIGTPLLFYMYLAPPFSHACSAFVVSAFVLTWLRIRERWHPAGLAALGALAALMTMVREQDALWVVGPVLDFGWTLIARSSRSPAEQRASGSSAIRLLMAGAAGCLAFAVAFTPQIIVYLTLNGRLGPSPLLSRKITLTSPHALQVLFSPEHGLVFWTPIAVLALAGLVLLVVAPPTGTGGDIRRKAICLLVMFAAEVYITGSVESWTVAGAFGQRRFIAMTVLIVVGLTVLSERWSRDRWRVPLMASVVVLAWWNVALMIQFSTGLMDRQRLELSRNAFNAFVVVPREVPRLLYRYVVDRESFYAPGSPPTGAPPRSVPK